MKDLARALVLDISALSRAVQPLIRDGYVRLVVNTVDGRSKRVILSKAGERKLAEGRALWVKAQARFEAAFGRGSGPRRCAETLMVLASEEFREKFQASG